MLLCLPLFVDIVPPPVEEESHISEYISVGVFREKEGFVFYGTCQRYSL
jgi:hypothetical protein